MDHRQHSERGQTEAEGEGTGDGFWGRPVGEVQAMGDELATLAGQIAAATAQFLDVLGEFDACRGWRAYSGLRTSAHWLSWRAGMDLRTAREHLRVACSLRELPVTADAFREGRLSYSKVRAIARVCTPQTEQEMVDIATHAPAAHVERLARGIRKAARRGGPEGEDLLPGQADDARGRFGARWHWDEETGDLVIWGRFTAADGATLLAALTRAELERIRTTDHPPPDDTPSDDTPSDGPATAEPPDDVSHTWPPDLTGPPPSDPGPALVAMAQMCLGATEAPAHAPAAEVDFLHGPADLAAGIPHRYGLAGDGSAEPRDGSVEQADGSAEPSPGAGALPDSTRVDAGPAIEEAAAQEAMCTAATRDVKLRRGAVLDDGTRRRKASPAQLRALHLRDRGCRTPACGRTRFLHAHPVVFWQAGGPTRMDDLTSA